MSYSTQHLQPPPSARMASRPSFLLPERGVSLRLLETPHRMQTQSQRFSLVTMWKGSEMAHRNEGGGYRLPMAQLPPCQFWKERWAGWTGSCSRASEMLWAMGGPPSHTGVGFTN